MRNMYILGSGYDWLDISLIRLKNMEGVVFVNERFPVGGKRKKYLARIHYSNKLNRLVRIPFKSIWYKQVRNRLSLNGFDDEEKILVVFDQNMMGGDNRFLKSIKKRYPNMIFIYVFTNVAKVSAASINGYINKLAEWYDIVYAFDYLDSVRYGFKYSPLIYDALPEIKSSMSSDISRVFYLGQAKDKKRLRMLIDIFKRIESLGIEEDFDIVNVPEDENELSGKIVYNVRIPYMEALQRISKASCLVDVLQDNSSGLTIKTCEAIAYNKKLITTNKYVAECPFYNPQFIRIIGSADDIDLPFFVENNEVRYSDSDKAFFSCDTFLSRVEADVRSLK